MTSYVSSELRRFVRERSQGLCEYCLIHESDTFYGCQVDHIISEKHGGPTVDGNIETRDVALFDLLFLLVAFRMGFRFGCHTANCAQ